MTIETNKVRVIASTYNQVEQAKEMIGEEFEVRSSWYVDNTISVYTADKSEQWIFNKSDVVFLTPVKFNGKHIGIGDEVEATLINRGIVTGFYMYDGEYRLVIETTANITVSRELKNITAHYPKGISKVTLSDEELIKELEKRGRVSKGKIIN